MIPAILFALAASTASPLVNPAVTQQNLQSTICTPGWTSTQRHVSSATKSVIYDTAGIPKGRRRYWVIDHVIPLEVGGSNNRANLAPQLLADARRKDVTENKAHRDVCAGRITLADAQAIFTSDKGTKR